MIMSLAEQTTLSHNSNTGVYLPSIKVKKSEQHLVKNLLLDKRRKTNHLDLMEHQPSFWGSNSDLSLFLDAWVYNQVQDGYHRCQIFQQIGEEEHRRSNSLSQHFFNSHGPCYSYGFPINCFTFFSSLQVLVNNPSLFNRLVFVEPKKYSGTDPSGYRMTWFEQTTHQPSAEHQFHDLSRRENQKASHPLKIEEHSCWSLHQLANALDQLSLSSFCFHLLRTTDIGLRGEKIDTSVNRSDIALWVAYSVHDHFLAKKIYSKALEVAKNRPLSSLSGFQLKILRREVVQLVENRLTLT